MGQTLVIEGGRRLEGTVRVGGAKNAVLPCMAAALLTGEDCYLENVPRIADVEFMIQVLESLGGRVEWSGAHCLRLNAANITALSPPADLVTSQRASFLVMGSLLGRFGYAACPPPGGDVIGQRPIDVHLAGFAALGATIGREAEKYVAKAQGLRGATIFLDYPSVLGTENLLLATSLSQGRSLLVNAACEPEVVCLAEMLQAMGARISGVGTHTIEVEGVASLHGAAHNIIPDRIEAGTFAIAAAITGGDVEIEGARPDHLMAFTAKLQEVGVRIEPGRAIPLRGSPGPSGLGSKGNMCLRVRGGDALRAVSIQAVPYPGLATDLQAPMAALLTQAHGTSYINERVFENRLLYVGELRKMGAEVVTTGTTAIIQGPTPLIGSQVRALDVRAGAAVVLAALVARGTTRVGEIHHLDRGYEALDQKLCSLGAVIQRIEE
ncbi:MAG TPA: UDP-N-acetylglucosamine 1-carboxyvinyltransferase [Dehalococcoidia bacterium]|nr:UDP-N-acetylglucosamine 1-carboxyvinyltransferase [Dehalococcoidia bacterium]HLB29565.1 UDP-N-acetylglucosamine 1-carboxyvinyltransferase [Dehalococcoidia bacterium]